MFLSLISSYAQDSVIRIHILADTSGMLETDSLIPIGMNIEFDNGKTKKIKLLTKEYADEFNITTENCSFADGYLHYSPKSVFKNGHHITCTISPKMYPSIKNKLSITIPYLVSFKILIDRTIMAKAGTVIPFNIRATFSNNNIFSFNSKDKKMSIPFNDFYFTLPDSILNQPFIHIPDPIENFYFTYSIKGKYRLDTSIVDELIIPINYNASYTFNFDGTNGKKGRNGSNGQGHEGVHGRDGQNGEDGQKGENGKNIRILLKSIICKKDTFIKLLFITNESTQRFVLDPKGSSILLNCNGGKGGNGGRGGNGSTGTDGGYDHDAGYGGDAGNGGFGGDGGNGGSVITYADSIANKYLHLILLQNKGGNGGIAGEGGIGGSGGYQDCGAEPCNTNGYNGVPGLNGYNGYTPEPMNYIIPAKHLDELMEVYEK